MNSSSAPSPHPIIRIQCHRSESPWSGYTSSAAEEQAGRTVQAVPALTGLEVPAHLAPWNRPAGPLLAIDRKNRRVVVHAQAFDTVQRAEVNRLKPNELHRLTTLRDLSLSTDPISLSRFLILSELILTYAHLESTLELVGSSEPTPGVRQTEWKGSHEYYTNEHHVSPLHFVIQIHVKTGEIWVKNL